MRLKRENLNKEGKLLLWVPWWKVIRHWILREVIIVKKEGKDHLFRLNKARLVDINLHQIELIQKWKYS